MNAVAGIGVGLADVRGTRPDALDTESAGPVNAGYPQDHQAYAMAIAPRRRRLLGGDTQARAP